MAQWDVYPNRNPRTKTEVPFLVDVQSNLLSDLRTRLVMPLVPNDVSPHGLPSRLVPTFEIGEHLMRLVAHEAGVVPAETLNAPVLSLRAEAHHILSAFDTVISGV